MAALTAGVAVAGYQLLRPETVAARHVPITTKIVFNREIAQIFQRKCFQCHTDGNLGVDLRNRLVRQVATGVLIRTNDERLATYAHGVLGP